MPERIFPIPLISDARGCGVFEGEELQPSASNPHLTQEAEDATALHGAERHRGAGGELQVKVEMLFWLVAPGEVTGRNFSSEKTCIESQNSLKVEGIHRDHQAQHLQAETTLTRK